MFPRTDALRWQKEAGDAAAAAGLGVGDLLLSEAAPGCVSRVCVVLPSGLVGAVGYGGRGEISRDVSRCLANPFEFYAGVFESVRLDRLELDPERHGHLVGGWGPRGAPPAAAALFDPDEMPHDALGAFTSIHVRPAAGEEISLAKYRGE